MNLQDYISRLAPKHRVPPSLAFAIAKVESNMEMTAIRHEPHFRWLWDVRKHAAFRRLSSAEVAASQAPDDFKALPSEYFYSSDDTEWMGQRTSWGPFQMMGALLRERGYRGPFPELCRDAELATRFALLHIEWLALRYGGKHGWAGVAAAYNAGRPRKDEQGRYLNRDYVVKVAQAGGKGVMHYV